MRISQFPTMYCVCPVEASIVLMDITMALSMSLLV